jgi:hypothetical protein
MPMRFSVRAYIPQAAVVLCLFASGVLLWSTVAQGAVGHGFSSAFGTFTGAVGVAVDDSTGVSKGDVYVVDQGAGQVDRFTASEAAHGEAGKQLTGAILATPHNVAVDDSGGASAGDVYVTEPTEGVVDKFNGVTGAYEAQLDGHEVPHTGSFEPVGVGVDPANGDVFVTDAHNGVVDVFTAAGNYSSQFGAGLLVSPAGVAVNGAGDAYVRTANDEVFEFIAAGGYASVLPVGVGVSAVSVDPASGDVYLDQGSRIEELGAGGESLGSFGSGTLSGSAGVGIDSATGTVYASNGAGAAIFTVGETPKEPVVTEAPVEVGGSAATFKGKLAGGETGYYFAYSTGSECTGAGGSGPVETTGSVEVSAVVGGLLPATRYAVCLVATNAFGQTVGPPVTFTTAAVAPSVGEESFSKVDSVSARLSTQIDPEGSATAYYYEYGPTSAYGATTAEVDLGSGQAAVPAVGQLTGLKANSEYHFRVVAVNKGGIEEGVDLAFRTLPVGVQGLSDGRVYEMVTPVSNENAEVYVPESFYTVVSEGTDTHLPFQASVNGNAVAYLGGATAGGNGEEGVSLGIEYLATRASNGGWTQVNLQPPGSKAAFYEGFSSDLSVGIVAAGICGYPERPPLSVGAPGNGYRVLYKRTDGVAGYEPLFTATPPNQSACSFGSNVRTGRSVSEAAYAGGSANSNEVLFEANDALLEGEGKLEKELQQDAKREAGEGQIQNYLYESIGTQLSLVDVLPGGTVEPNATFGSPPAGPPDRTPNFSHVISEDGTRVFWTAINTGEIYVRENGMKTVPVSEGPAQFRTATPDGKYAFYTSGGKLYRFDVETETRQEVAGGAAGVLGVIGVSNSGEYIYFVAEGELATGATQGEPNLYMSHGDPESWETPTFIATLSPEDGSEVPPYNGRDNSPYKIGDWQPGQEVRTAEVTPNGRALVFMSNRGLKVSPSLEAYQNSGSEEVYVYEAEGSHLFCASCNPSGESGSSGYLPISWTNTYSPRWLSEDGNRVFFDSGSALVARDTDGTQDVYEWERDGTGSCEESAGCIYLLTGGTSKSPSWLAGEGADGNDVFVITRAQLVPEDQNENFDLYDARVGGVQTLAPPECSGTGCQGVPSAPPVFATPASVTFEGVGNFSAPLKALATEKKAKQKPRRKKPKQEKAKKRRAQKSKKHNGKSDARGDR